MFISDIQEDGSILVHIIAPLSQITWGCGSSGEYKDPATKALLDIEAACRYDEFLGAPSTVEVGRFNSDDAVLCAVSLEMPEQEMVKLIENCCAEDETQAGAHVDIKAIVPPNEHRVLATVEYVWSDRQSPEATS